MGFSSRSVRCISLKPFANLIPLLFRVLWAGFLGLQLGILYMSFMFFTKQFQAARVKEAIKIMEDSENDDVSQILKPVPKGEESVSFFACVVMICIFVYCVFLCFCAL